MADLKAGTTVGGALVWHQGNFPLSAVSEDVYYKEHKIYTEHNRPQASDNDFVSKASGGTYLGKVTFDVGLNIKDRDGYLIEINKNSNPGDQFDYSAFMRIKDRFAIETNAGTPFILFNPTTDGAQNRLMVMGRFSAMSVWEEGKRVFSPNNLPTPADVSLGNVTNDKQVKLLDPGTQTITGSLDVLNLSSRNPATLPAHVPRLDQVVTKGTIIDFGEY